MTEESNAKTVHIPGPVMVRLEKVIAEYQETAKVSKLYPWQAIDMLLKEHEEKK